MDGNDCVAVHAIQGEDMQIATLLKSDGSETAIEPKNGKKFSLEELQKYVGGYIELTWTKKPTREMYVNEEGKLHNLPVNWEATRLHRNSPPDLIVGDVVVMAPRAPKRQKPKA